MIYNQFMEETARIVLSFPRSIRILLYTVLIFGSFVIPFSASQHQIITGSIVNALLIGSAIIFPKKLLLPIIFLPSLAVLSRGIIFGPFTMFLVYFLPVIWLGNFVLVLLFSRTYVKLGHWGALGISASAKYLLLFSFANLFFRFQLVPKIFVQTMGLFQLITAVLGGILVYFVLKGLRGR